MRKALGGCSSGGGLETITLIFFYKGQFIRAKMMSTENFGKNKGQSVLNFLDEKGQAWGQKY